MVVATFVVEVFYQFCAIMRVTCVECLNLVVAYNEQPVCGHKSLERYYAVAQIEIDGKGVEWVTRVNIGAEGVNTPCGLLRLDIRSQGLVALYIEYGWLIHAI